MPRALLCLLACATLTLASACDGAGEHYAGSEDYGARPYEAQNGMQQQGQLQNDYCSVRTFHNDAVPFRGFATHDQNGPVIFIRSDGMQNPDLFRFILAHECGHHAHQNVSTPPVSAEDNARRELDADCWAATTMSQRGDAAAINAALEDVAASGYDGRGPTPQARYAAIQQCAGQPTTPGK